MNSSSSPPVLYLGDDDDDDNNNSELNSYFGINQTIPRISSSIEINSAHKKRKLFNQNFHSNSIINKQSKRQRNDQYQQRLPSTTIDSDHDSELILLDPNDYIIEKPESQQFRSFDWTIETQSTRAYPNVSTTASNLSITDDNNESKRSMDKINTIARKNSKEKFIQQQSTKSHVMPPPSSSKSTSSCARLTTQRGRPTKNSRIHTIQSTSAYSSIPSQPILVQKQQPSRPPSLTSSSSSSTTKTISPLSINNIPSEIRRQMLNSTGLFSAFYDSKYYHCNICKFKSVTSSTLLQHLFTHMFFCDHCSYYTYSSFSLSQHIFEKHHRNFIEDIPQSLSPTSFDLLYVTRCLDGTFALFMDSSTKSTTNKIMNNDQRLIISSGMPNDQQSNKTTKKNFSQMQDIPLDINCHIPSVLEKRERTSRLFGRSKCEKKSKKTYALMKHRPCYIMKKSSCLHALTLEYNICREHTIRHMSHTEHIEKRRKFSSFIPRTRLIDEVADCLKTIINKIVDIEEYSDQVSLIQPLSNDVLHRIFPMNDLNMFMKFLKLNNKYDRDVKEKQIYENEYSLRQGNEHVFTLSSPETNQTEQTIITSLHSSMTNGDSIFTQTKIKKIPNNFDNTHRYLKGNSNQQITTNNTTKPISIVSKPSHSLSNSTVDRNNNSVSSSKSLSSTPMVIILD